jgi:hypothetical protein
VGNNGNMIFGFFSGLFGGSGGDWESSWVCVVVSGLLRMVVVCEGAYFVVWAWELIVCYDCGDYVVYGGYSYWR